MDVTHLPLLKDFTPLHDAVKAMRVQQRSAVLRESAASLGLIEIPKIFAALADKQTSLFNVSVAEPVYRLMPADISNWNLDTRRPGNTWQAYEQFLKSVSHDYVLLDSFGDTGLIVTLHEGQTQKIKTRPNDCYCRGPKEHSFPPPQISSGGSCTACGFPVHCE